jgi:hypothetical protein
MNLYKSLTEGGAPLDNFSRGVGGSFANGICNAIDMLDSMYIDLQVVT